MPDCQRRHYKAIAAIFRETNNIPAIKEKLARLFESDNMLFDRDKFLEAASFRGHS